MHQYVLDLICLLDLDADPDAVHTWFYQNLFVLVPGDGQGVEEDFGAAGGFDFRHVVSFGRLRCEVGEGKGSGQG